MTRKRGYFVMMVSALVIFVSGLIATAAENALMMATTTSTDNTGLLDVLAPRCKEATGIELKWTAVGTGKALEMGKNCDVDVLLVHAPGAEKTYVAHGYGKDRTPVMYNDFVLIGPPDDPAGLKGQSVATAMQKLADQKVRFVSRGDNSGTHKKEISLWKRAGMKVPDRAEWYIQTGQGMMATIRVAIEKVGYTLTDRGTFIKFAHNHHGSPPLTIKVEGDAVLFNQYSVLAVNPDNCADTQYDLAKKFIKWMTSDDTQEFIGNFTLLGRKLFIPNAQK